MPGCCHMRDPNFPRGEAEMFETSGITDLMEKSSWQKYVLWFAAGCFVTILIFYMLLIPGAKRAAAESAEKAALQKFSAELAKNPVEVQLEGTKPAFKPPPKEREESKPSLEPQTTLSANSILIAPAKIWIIPADVEPI